MGRKLCIGAGAGEPGQGASGGPGPRVGATGSDDAQTVRKQMMDTPINDMFAKNGIIREDGRMVHDMYLAQVKTPEESTGEWDLYNIVRTIPAAEAYRPLSESKCDLVTGN